MKKINVLISNNVKYRNCNYIKSIKSKIEYFKWVGIYFRKDKFYLYMKDDKFQIGFDFKDINNLIGFLVDVCESYDICFENKDKYSYLYPREIVEDMFDELNKYDVFSSSNIVFNKVFEVSNYDKYEVLRDI